MELVLYDQMCVAIAQCAAVDEAAGIKDRAEQLQAYARVRDNSEAERQFAEIRLRASIRIGELSRDLEISKGGRPNNSSERSPEFSKADTLKQAGIAIRTANDYEQLTGGREEQAQKVATNAAELYFAGISQIVNGGQDKVSCGKCGRYLYFRPKSESGKPRSIVQTLRNVPSGKRATVLLRANGHCELCGRSFQKSNHHISHLISLEAFSQQNLPEDEKRRLANSIWNLAAFCEECNSGLRTDSATPLFILLIAIKTKEWTLQNQSEKD